MNFCPKCGNKLNNQDLFCSNCGAKIEDRVQQVVSQSPGKDFFNSTCEPTVVETKGSPVLSTVSLILSITGIACLIACFAIAIAAYGDATNTQVLFFTLLFMVSFVLSAVSLGLGIPGFVLSKKRRIKSAMAIAALVVSCIAVSLFLVLYIIASFE